MRIKRILLSDRMEQKLGSSPHIGPKFVIIVFSEVDAQGNPFRKGREPLDRLK
jgi:hypothetical protein